MREQGAVATTSDIVTHFIYTCLQHPEFVSGNWGLSADRELWNVNGETYINGVMLTIDADFMMGYLIECVDRSAGTLTYIAIATYHGFGVKNGFVHLSHDWAVYEPWCGSFGNRTEAAHPTAVMSWAVAFINECFATHEAAGC